MRGIYINITCKIFPSENNLIWILKGCRNFANDHQILRAISQIAQFIFELILQLLLYHRPFLVHEGVLFDPVK